MIQRRTTRAKSLKLAKHRSYFNKFLEHLKANGKQLSPEEFRYLAMNSLESSGDFSALHNLEMTPSLLSPEQRALCRRAWFDLRDVSALLEQSGNIQGAIVHAHEAAEKYLKVALLHEGVPLKKLGKGKLMHDLDDIVKELMSLHKKYAFLRKPAHDLHRLLGSMNARYTTLNRSLKDAIDAYRFARHSCGFVAQQIQMDKARSGPEVDFVEGRYYQDFAGRQYRFCGSILKDGKWLSALHLLEATSRGQTIDGLILFEAPCNFHYKTITDSQDIRRLQNRSLRIKQDRQPQTQEHSGVTIDRVDESFDAILQVRTRLRTK